MSEPEIKLETAQSEDLTDPEIEHVRRWCDTLDTMLGSDAARIEWLKGWLLHALVAFERMRNQRDRAEQSALTFCEGIARRNGEIRVLRSARSLESSTLTALRAGMDELEAMLAEARKDRDDAKLLLSVKMETVEGLRETLADKELRLRAAQAEVARLTKEIAHEALVGTP